MNAILGTVKNGQVIFDTPSSLPDGCRVMVEPLPEVQTFGMREEDWQDTPEAIAAWLNWYDSLEPLDMTPEEEADWFAALAERREQATVAFGKRAEQLERMWE